MAEQKPSKLTTRVRLPVAAPNKKPAEAGLVQCDYALYKSSRERYNSRCQGIKQEREVVSAFFHGV